MSQLIITLGSISVTLDKFESFDYPRIYPDSLNDSVIYTADGSTAGNGFSQFDKFQFDITARCTQSQEEMIQLLCAEYRYRRQNGLDASVIVDDKTQKHAERLPRTRALATGTSATNYPSVSPTHALYYPKVKCWIERMPKFTLSGVYTTVNMLLTETEKYEA